LLPVRDIHRAQGSAHGRWLEIEGTKEDWVDIFIRWGSDGSSLCASVLKMSDVGGSGYEPDRAVALLVETASHRMSDSLTAAFC
jgi:hypothetical protein